MSIGESPVATRAVVASVSVESPHVVRYQIYVRKPGATDFPEVDSGTDPGGRHPLGNLAAGSTVGASFNIAGNPRTAYRIRFFCEVDGQRVPSEPPLVAGVTDDSGADAKTATVGVS